LGPSKGSTQRIFQAKKFLSKLYKLLPMIQTKYGTNIQRLSISQSTPRHGEMKIVAEICRNIRFQSGLKIGKFSRALSKRPKTTFSTKKFKKLPTRIAAHKTYKLGQKV